VVCFPHPEQTTWAKTLSLNELEPEDDPPRVALRLLLQALQRLGSLRNFLSWKKLCSPAVKTKSTPQSIHFNTLSWNSIEGSLQPASDRHTRTTVRHCEKASWYFPLKTAQRIWLTTRLQSAWKLLVARRTGAPETVDDWLALLNTGGGQI